MPQILSAFLLAPIEIRSPETVRSRAVIPNSACQAEAGQLGLLLPEISEMRQIVRHRSKPAMPGEYFFDALILIFGNIEGEQ